MTLDKLRSGFQNVAMWKLLARADRSGFRFARYSLAPADLLRTGYFRLSRSRRGHSLVSCRVATPHFALIRLVCVALFLLSGLVVQGWAAPFAGIHGPRPYGRAVANPNRTASPAVVSPPARSIAPQPVSTTNVPHPAVARIIVPEGDGISYGSGTLVDVRDQFALVITNWHVVRDSKGTIEVVFPDGFRSPARAVKMDSNWDLAALVIWRPKAKPAKLASRAPQRGDVLTIAGYGKGDYRTATGRCTQYLAPGAEFPFEMLELSAEARQGDSGGPIFNSQGEMAGVLFGAANGTTSGSYCGRVSGFLASLAPNLKPGLDGLDPNRELIAGTETPGGATFGDDLSDIADPDSGWRTVTPDRERPGDLEEGSPEVSLAENPPRRWNQKPADFIATKPQPEPAKVPAPREPAALAAMSAAPVAEGSPSDEELGDASNSDYTEFPARRELQSETATFETSTLEPDPPRTITWQDLAGRSLFEQIKSGLACFGAAVVLWKVFRVIG